MAQIVIINGSPNPEGYWANEVRGDRLLLLTHCSAAMTLAIARQRKDPIYWYVTGTRGVPFFGPLTLAKWERRAGFFTLHFEGIRRPATPLRGPQAAAGEAAQREIGRMRHLILCEGANVKYVNMEHPLSHQRHPTPEQVEEALRAGDVSTPVA
jgi:hypothetical protein